MSRRRNKLRNRKRMIISFVPVTIVAIIIGFLFLLTFLSLFNMGNNKIINNVFINGISVSGLSTSEAKEKLNQEFEKTLSQEISITFGDYSTSFLPAEINFSYDIPKSLENAYSLGRTGNIITNNFKILISSFKKNVITAEINYDENKLENIIDNISVEIPNLVVEPSYYISNDELIVTKGTAGNSLNKEKTKNMLISAIMNNEKNITLPVETISAQDVDIDKIYSEVHCEPQNASVTKNPYNISVEKKGVDFAVSIEEVKNMLSNPEITEITIPLKYTEAEITVADLGEDIFGYKISSFPTKYDATNTNRATNLTLACEKINGTVLQPGEIFSFNKVVGERTTKNGFKDAIIYVDGELDYGIGGGICQVSSTLYNAVLFANLDIVERKNHSMTVNYVPIGQDATVSYGSVDFKFKNSRKYPIKIVATTNSGILTISIYGIKEEKEYTVTLDVETIEKVDFETTYEYSSKIPVNQEYIKQTGKYGYKCSTYKVVSYGDQEISRTLLSTDTYKPQKQIIQKHK